MGFLSRFSQGKVVKVDGKEDGCFALDLRVAACSEGGNVKRRCTVNGRAEALGGSGGLVGVGRG
jgi:hypothetical protein